MELDTDKLQQAVHTAVVQNSQRDDEENEILGTRDGDEVAEEGGGDESADENESLVSADEDESAPAHDGAPTQPAKKRKKNIVNLNINEIVTKHTSASKESNYLYLVYQKDLAIVKVGITKLSRDALLRRYRTYYHTVHEYELYKIKNGRSRN
jgi:hypothetical protein